MNFYRVVVVKSFIDKVHTGQVPYNEFAQAKQKQFSKLRKSNNQIIKVKYISLLWLIFIGIYIVVLKISMIISFNEILILKKQTVIL